MKKPAADSLLAQTGEDKDAADNRAFNARAALLSLTSSSIDDFDQNSRSLLASAENNLYTKTDEDFALNGGYIGAFNSSASETTKNWISLGEPSWDTDIPKLKRVSPPPGFPSLPAFPFCS